MKGGDLSDVRQTTLFARGPTPCIKSDKKTGPAGRFGDGIAASGVPDGKPELLGEVGVGLHAMFANVETFDLFLFGDPQATKQSSDDRPQDQ